MTRFIKPNPNQDNIYKEFRFQSSLRKYQNKPTKRLKCDYNCQHCLHHHNHPHPKKQQTSPLPQQHHHNHPLSKSNRKYPYKSPNHQPSPSQHSLISNRSIKISHNQSSKYHSRNKNQLQKKIYEELQLSNYNDNRNKDGQKQKRQISNDEFNSNQIEEEVYLNEFQNGESMNLQKEEDFNNFDYIQIENNQEEEYRKEYVQQHHDDLKMEQEEKQKQQAEIQLQIIQKRQIFEYLHDQNHQHYNPNSQAQSFDQKNNKATFNSSKDENFNDLKDYVRQSFDQKQEEEMICEIQQLSVRQINQIILQQKQKAQINEQISYIQIENVKLTNISLQQKHESSSSPQIKQQSTPYQPFTPNCHQTNIITQNKQSITLNAPIQNQHLCQLSQPQEEYQKQSFYFRNHNDMITFTMSNTSEVCISNSSSSNKSNDVKNHEENVNMIIYGSMNSQYQGIQVQQLDNLQKQKVLEEENINQGKNQYMSEEKEILLQTIKNQQQINQASTINQPQSYSLANQQQIPLITTPTTSTTSTTNPKCFVFQGGRIYIQAFNKRSYISVRVFNKLIKRYPNIDELLQLLMQQRPYLQSKRDQIRQELYEYRGMNFNVIL